MCALYLFLRCRISLWPRSWFMTHEPPSLVLLLSQDLPKLLVTRFVLLGACAALYCCGTGYWVSMTTSKRVWQKHTWQLTTCLVPALILILWDCIVQYSISIQTLFLWMWMWFKVLPMRKTSGSGMPEICFFQIYQPHLHVKQQNHKFNSLGRGQLRGYLPFVE